MIDRGRHNVLGVLIDAVDYDAAVSRVFDAARAGRTLAVSALAVHGVMTGVLDRDHRGRLNRFDLVTPDGQPVRWALNLLYGARLPERVYGPELMNRLCALAAEERMAIFLYGSRSEVLTSLERRLVAHFPELKIAGRRPSAFRPISESERQEILAEIRGSGASLTFVGLGCPRQELWVSQNASAIGMPAIAVGAAFDFHAGLLRQAPGTLQRLGLEWLFRLAMEPRRLWSRYLLLNPLYVALLTAQASRLWHPEVVNSSARAQAPLAG